MYTIGYFLKLSKYFLNNFNFLIIFVEAYISFSLKKYIIMLCFIFKPKFLFNYDLTIFISLYNLDVNISYNV